MVNFANFSCSLVNFENPFHKDKSVGLQEIPDTTKVVKFALIVQLEKLEFTYITVVK